MTINTEPKTETAKESKPAKKIDLGLWFLLVSSFLLMTAWSFATPIFESPDEHLHWLYARYVHDTWSMPVYTAESSEGLYSPLYYFIVAPFATDTPFPPFYVGKNGDTPVIQDNKVILAPTQVFQHSLDDFGKYWPVRIVRLLSVVMGVLTVLFCYWLGKEATGKAITGLLVGGLVAFLPMFAFRSSNVSGDVALAMFCALATYLLVRLYKHGFSWGVAIGAIIAASAAFWSKPFAGILAVPFALIILTQKASWRSQLLRLSLIGIIGLALVAPWLIRNWLLYGDLFALERANLNHTMFENKKSIFSPFFFTTFPALLTLSFIGVFGWLNFFMPWPIYFLFGIVGLVIIVGCVWGLLKNLIDRKLFAILITLPIFNLAIIIYMNLAYTQVQGRHLLPALPALALIAAFGLEALPFWSNRLTKILVGSLLALNVFILVAIVIPHYWL